MPVRASALPLTLRSGRRATIGRLGVLVFVLILVPIRFSIHPIPGSLALAPAISLHSRRDCRTRASCATGTLRGA